ncbi:hypothetical protein KCU87_g36, partial [Aureobasidium melanogenum]
MNCDYRRLTLCASLGKKKSGKTRNEREKKSNFSNTPYHINSLQAKTSTLRKRSISKTSLFSNLQDGSSRINSVCVIHHINITSRSSTASKLSRVVTTYVGFGDGYGGIY